MLVGLIRFCVVVGVDDDVDDVIPLWWFLDAQEDDSEVFIATSFPLVLEVSSIS